jgi:hypothetical protein
MIPHACGYSLFGGTEESTSRLVSTKQRAGGKRNSMLCDMETQRELQVLDRRAQDMIEAIAVDYDLPLCSIAPYRTDHPLLKNLSANLLKNSTTNGTINLYCNAGFFPNELCKLARASNQVMFGSSANLTGTGQRFRVNDVQLEVRAIADLIIDYGLCRYHTYKHSATIINFATLKVVRIGACYEQIADILKRHFDWEVPADPGLHENPSGHLQGLTLKDNDAS